MALMFVGYGSHVQAFKDTMPGVLIVTLDIDPKFNPTIVCDYLQFEWQPFIDKAWYSSSYCVHAPVRTQKSTTQSWHAL